MNIVFKCKGKDLVKTLNVTALTDLPAAAMVVEELKNNQNPAIRIAAIDSLRCIKRPEYKEDLSKIFTIAQSDADEGVAAAVKEALEDLDKPQEQPNQA